MDPFIRIDKGKDQFTICAAGASAQVRPYITRSAFPLLACYKTEPLKKRAKAFLDRTAILNFDGVRLFGETSWELTTTGFFGNPKYTPRLDVVGADAPPNSSVFISEKYWDMVEELAEDLKQRSLIAEFCCLATIKNRDVGMLGHLLNDFARGFDKRFKARKCPFIFEIVNEGDTYSLITPGEAKGMVDRWRRSSTPAKPEERNFPGSLIGFSCGGDWTPYFDDSGATHRNIHPPRGKNWELGPKGEEIDEYIPILKAANSSRPLAFNETVNCWEKSLREEHLDWAKKWDGLSTTSPIKAQAYAYDVLSAGVSYCFHDVYGMSVVMAYMKPWNAFEETMSDIIADLRRSWL